MLFFLAHNHETKGEDSITFSNPKIYVVKPTPPEINIMLILKEEKKVMRERGSMTTMRESLPVFLGGREAWVYTWEEKERVTVFCLHK